MGGKSEKGDTMEWSSQNTKALYSTNIRSSEEKMNCNHQHLSPRFGKK